MGDQVGLAVGGTLYYVPYNEFERISSLSIGSIEKTELFSALCRINTLYMIARSGSGHIGSSFSSMDIMSWLQLNEFCEGASKNDGFSRDTFFSSKGHDAPALYSTWIGLGKLEFNLIHKLRQINGLPGHPDVCTPNVVANTGSLGMGISKAKGMIFANRLQKQVGRVFVLMGDGELQEGQVWESLVSAANSKLHELTVIVDHNKLQSDTLVSKVSDLGDLERKFTAFGWYASRCDGNDLNSFSDALAKSKGITDKPKVIIADTIKGKGVSFMEHTAIDSDVELYKFHSGAPTADTYVKAAQELIDSANLKLNAVNAEALALESVTRPALVQTERTERLINAYTNALIDEASKNSKIVALDADLVVDTGLIPFRDQYPDRFVECGIAEQDMVSQAGGMALQGLLPVVHSFSCFLSSRPNEQIYNNSTEKTKIIYVGSLAGLLPAGPGHSHQAVRDISALAAVPGLLIVEPCCEAEVAPLFKWCINENSKSSYFRLVSAPSFVPYKLPSKYEPALGRGCALTEGSDAVMIGYGPVTLSQAYEAASLLRKEHGVGLKVINLPWLNKIDAEWLEGEIGDAKVLFSIDNHYRIGGQGACLAEIFSTGRLSDKTLVNIAIDDIPACGTNSEVLAYHGFDSISLVDKVLKEIQAFNKSSCN